MDTLLRSARQPGALGKCFRAADASLEGKRCRLYRRDGGRVRLFLSRRDDREHGRSNAAADALKTRRHRFEREPRRALLASGPSDDAVHSPALAPELVAGPGLRLGQPEQFQSESSPG